jgi:SDR family mycofactocin-dependent oxidoreductase
MAGTLSPLTDQVALITGAARGQGRAHALGLAEDGADVVICDIGAQIDSVPYPLASEDDLHETAQLVEKLGRQCLVAICDVRDPRAVESLVADAMERFGRIDIAVPNAGIASYGTVEELTDTQWRDMLDTNLSGVFHVMRAVVPGMRQRGYGRIVATASMAARGGTANAAHYVAAKWGVIGLVKSLSIEVAAQGITVNAVCPANVNTTMIKNDTMYKLFRPDLESPELEDVLPGFTDFHRIPVPWVEPEEITRVVRFLADPGSTFISGSTFDVACGNTALIP